MKKIVIHPQVEATITELLQYLNQLSGRSIVVEGERAEKSRNMVRRLLARNYTSQEVKEVIQCKCFEWGNNPKMFEYLHPSTLFSGNFQKYLDLVTDLKANPEKAELFKKKINGTTKGRNGHNLDAERTRQQENLLDGDERLNRFRGMGYAG